MIFRVYIGVSLFGIQCIITLLGLQSKLCNEGNHWDVESHWNFSSGMVIIMVKFNRLMNLYASAHLGKP